MKRCLILMGMISLGILHAEDLGPILQPGKYMMSITAPVDSEMADRIKARLNHFDTIKSVRIKEKMAEIHFTVREKRQVNAERLKQAVLAAAPSHTITELVREPIPSHENLPSSLR